jgi:hypothetical protein
MTKAEVCDHPGLDVSPTYHDYGADSLKVDHASAEAGDAP